jgi:galactose oxidase
MFVAPNGKLFVPGPTPNMQWYDLMGDGSVSFAGTRGDDTFSQNDSTVMYAGGKLLKAGGNVNYDKEDAASFASSAAAYVIDIDTDSAQVHAVQPLRRGRAFANGVVLPSGEVLIVGGLDNGAAFSDTGAVLTPELFDPETEQWSDVSPMTVPRTYHSVALLMPDGRVFVGGGGQCGDCAVNHLNAEIFSPAYLFQAERPRIRLAPARVSYGSEYHVKASGRITSFAWIRLSSVTHTVNNDQRRLLAHAKRRRAGIFSIEAPADGNLAPPGYYMLFALNGKTPSIARIIRIASCAENESL